MGCGGGAGGGGGGGAASATGGATLGSTGGGAATGDERGLGGSRRSSDGGGALTAATEAGIADAGAEAGGGAAEGCEGATEDPSGFCAARRLTTVGRIRSSTTLGDFCFSRWRLTRSIASGAIALMWFFASVTPTDCRSATSALLSIPRSRATS